MHSLLELSAFPLGIKSTLTVGKLRSRTSKGGGVKVTFESVGIDLISKVRYS